ncbi:hypothetical protein [Maribacter algarum]|uniref:hypothetical protein n=1 Tax=Maribacter algarum (ex Zhang et al. 2020) TaxID=2578118 RepID=UPI001486C8FC|nr:hypothetical protein [Maribacter algarum]
MQFFLFKATEVTKEQFWTGAAIIGGIILVSYLITTYTKYGGGGDYGNGGDDLDSTDVL